MKKSLLVIENDFTLENASYVKFFMSKYDGEIVEMTRFNNRSSEEIFKAVSKCTDIAVQTCFVNGSDSQLHEMVGLLSKISHPINIYIAYIGLRHQNDLYDYFVEELSIKQLMSIERHKVYAMSRDRYESIAENEPNLLLDFTSVLSKEYKRLSKKSSYNRYIEYYKETALLAQQGEKY